MTVIIFRWMEVYPDKLDCTPHHVRSAWCVWCVPGRQIFRGIPPSAEKLLHLLIIIKLNTHYKCQKISLTLTLLTALLLTLITTYFQFGGLRYTCTRLVLTNRNHSYMTILNCSTKCATKVLCANCQRDKCIIWFDTKYKKKHKGIFWALIFELVGISNIRWLTDTCKYYGIGTSIMLSLITLDVAV